MTMSWDEVIDLLKIATVYDHRQRSEEDVVAWSHVAQLSGWSCEEAVRAMHEYFSTRTDFLLPGHIGAIIRAHRQQPPVRRPALPGPVPATGMHIRATMDELAEQLHWRRSPPGSSEVDALDVECPYCHARPKSRCTRRIHRGHRKGQYVPLEGVHPSRVELRKESAEGEYGVEGGGRE